MIPRITGALLLCVSAGCAQLGSQGGNFSSHLESPAMAVRDCAEWFRAMDDQVEQAGVRDAQHSPMHGFPYLRVDRLLASLKDRAAHSDAAINAYADRLMELDLEARRIEMENLPCAAVDALPGMGPDSTRAAANARSRACSRLLREIDVAKQQSRAALLASAQVPDDYSRIARIVGLYPLTRLAFSQGVRRWEAESRAAFSGEPAAREGANIVRFAPPAGTPVLTRAAAAAYLARADLDPLGMPILSTAELARFAAAYAPSFEVVITGDHDRFGELRWRRGAGVPEVNAAETAVYFQHAYARYRDHKGMDQILLQLVYTIWFPERPPESTHDILAGMLDGLVWRVTLAPDGEPLLYDAMHACGCYHQFFPTPRARPRPAPDALEEWAFVPLSLARIGEGERPVVKVGPRSHYIEGIGLARGADSVVRYSFRDYDELRSMRLLEGGQRSAFGPDGLIAGTERLERFLFWPMGIRSAGAMRQWGRQATAFVGRRHFDDADLLERRFEIDLTPLPQ